MKVQVQSSNEQDQIYRLTVPSIESFQIHRPEAKHQSLDTKKFNLN